MTPRITFEQALAFAIDRGAFALWVDGSDLRYKAMRHGMRPPYLPEEVNGYMKLAAPLLSDYPEEPKQLLLPFGSIVKV